MNQLEVREFHIRSEAAAYLEDAYILEAGLAVFVVTWNLNKERSNYSHARDEFIRHLERLDNIGDPGLESVRFISTNISASQVSDYLRQKMDNNDKIFVSKLNRGEHQGWLSKTVWDWINARA